MLPASLAYGLILWLCTRRVRLLIGLSFIHRGCLAALRPDLSAEGSFEMSSAKFKIDSSTCIE